MNFEAVVAGYQQRCVELGWPEGLEKGAGLLDSLKKGMGQVGDWAKANPKTAGGLTGGTLGGIAGGMMGGGRGMVGGMLAGGAAGVGAGHWWDQNQQSTGGQPGLAPEDKALIQTRGWADAAPTPGPYNSGMDPETMRRYKILEDWERGHSNLPGGGSTQRPLRGAEAFEEIM